jgi:diguanylate cyclase (GGDEF)-like protein
MLPARTFLIALTGAGGELSFPYFVDGFADAPESHWLEDSARAAEVVRTGDRVLHAADTASGLPTRNSDTPQDWLGIPLRMPRGVIGALVVQNAMGDARYGERESRLMQFAALHVAMAIERDQLQLQIRHMAQYDGLTGLPNRALFIDRLRVAFAQARRSRQGLALMNLDVDHFMRVNDRHGQGSGDALLQQVAARLRTCLRASDTVARLGGDEFAVLLLPVDSPETLVTIAEKLRTALRAPFDLAGQAMPITCSIGIAMAAAQDREEQDLTRRADSAKHRAKSGGRDNVVIDNGVAGPESPGG